MRAADLDIHELLHFLPEGGIITFAGERVLLLDAVALGLLRKELIQTLGMTAARLVFTRFGYAHGWRVAEMLRKGFPWDSEDEWRIAGARLHTIQGLVRAEVTRASLNSAAPGAEGIWHDSYEAEQHLLHLGQADEPVCWTLTGFATGYMSCVYGKEIIAIEDRCRGKGDAVCRAIVRSKDEWGPELATHLPFYDKEACLDAALMQLTDTLKKKERQLQSRRALRQIDPRVPAGLVGSSPAMLRTLDLARRVAQVDSTVLITGESGAGKERIARFIHDESARTAGPFLAINCAAVPETLLESELFGHARGAFTGASQDRAGLFEAANGGTLLLDEIGDVPPAMQVKLLRVLQEREVRRVGENRARTINVRVLAATNRDLLADVHGARFRQDLYYRLRVVEVVVPPLRERREDILPLARQLLAGSRQAIWEEGASAHTRRRESAAASTRGPATCANWRMRWSGPSRSCNRIALASMTCRRKSARRLRPVRQLARFARSRRSNATTLPPRCGPQAATAPRPPKAWASAPRRCTGN